MFHTGCLWLDNLSRAWQRGVINQILVAPRANSQKRRLTAVACPRDLLASTLGFGSVHQRLSQPWCNRNGSPCCHGHHRGWALNCALIPLARESALDKDRRLPCAVGAAGRRSRPV